ncbi:MAG: hypothetical protein ISR65_08455 [Bacteriovoracaceae bacterium]|nr:hypothetical protein [Bacteriovoracaceae bacterium]
MNVIKFKPILLTAIYLLFSYQMASANDCTDIRLDRPNYSMERVPVTNQGGLGICYSHIAASLVDSYRFFNNTQNTQEPNPHYTSALALAVNYRDDNNNFFYNDKDIESGHICSAVKSLLKHGSCNKEAINKQLLKIESLIYTLDSERQSRFINMLENVEAKESLDELLESIEQVIIKQNLIPTHLASSLRSRVLDATNSVFKTLNLKKIVTDLLCEGQTVALDHLEVQCNINDLLNADNRPLACFGSECLDDEDDEDVMTLLEQIHAVLDKGVDARPIGIEYCSKVLEDKSYRRNLLTYFFPENTECGPHGSMIIGRKKAANGQCHLLVRNTWGTQSHTYDWESESGHIWVEQNALADNLFKVVTLVDK